MKKLIALLAVFALVGQASAGMAISTGIPPSLSLDALSVTPISTSTTPITVTQISGETTPMQIWQNSSDVVQSEILSNGKFSGTLLNSVLQNGVLQGNNTASPVSTIEGITGQTADLLDVLTTATGTNEFNISAAGVTTFNLPPQSTAPCASGYTRVTPDFCKATGAATFGDFAINNCDQSAALAGVTDAVAIMIDARAAIYSQDAVGPDSAYVNFYGPADTGCANALDEASGGQYEFVAVTANTLLSTNNQDLILATNADGQYYFVSGGTTNSIVNDAVLGYFD